MSEAEQWLAKALHNAPRPLPAGRFPALLSEAEHSGFSHEEMMDVVDLWLGHAYCRISDPISTDIELLPAGERQFY